MERQAIHGDADAMTFELSCEDFADKLAALIGVEDRRSATAGNRLLYTLYAINLLHGVGQAPCQHFAAVPLDSPLNPQSQPIAYL